jgi:hypothetical protein
MPTPAYGRVALWGFPRKYLLRAKVHPRGVEGVVPISIMHPRLERMPRTIAGYSHLEILISIFTAGVSSFFANCHYALPTETGLLSQHAY